MVDPSEPQELHVHDLHIFVNRRKFEEGDGVQSEMTGRQIAALVNVPAENAIVRVESGPDQGELGVDTVITIVNAMHFWLQGASSKEVDVPGERVERELARLREGGQHADLVFAERWYVVYRGVPTAGARFSLPADTDVIVPVPEGYPAAMIDLAGLPKDSPLLPRLKGGQNNQGQPSVGGVEWQLASYHPHNGGGGPPWDSAKHGFDTYLDHVIAWLDRLA